MYENIADEIYTSLNKLRTNPSEFALKLSKESKNYKENLLKIRKNAVPVQTREGLSGLEDSVEYLKVQRSINSLTLSEGLTRTAQLHINDTGPLGIVGHMGTKDTTLQTRLEMFGKWSDCIGETLEYGCVSGFEVVSDLVIDDGLPSRPHRGIVMNPRFNKVGIAVGRHSQFLTVACCVFAGGFVEKDEMVEVEFGEESWTGEYEVGNWVEDAVRMTCEIRTEEEAGRVWRKIRRFWEMADGTIATTEEVVNGC